MTALAEGNAKLPDRTSWKKCRDVIAAMPGHRITLTPKQAEELSDASQSDLPLLKAEYGIEFQEPASKYVRDSDLSAETAMITEIAKVVATMIPHWHLSVLAGYTRDGCHRLMGFRGSSTAGNARTTRMSRGMSHRTAAAIVSRIKSQTLSPSGRLRRP